MWSGFICIALLVLCNIEAARILAVFPMASISHQTPFRPLTQALAKRGHEVVVITPNPAFPKGQAPPNLTEIDVHDISYRLWNERFMALSSKGSKSDWRTQISTLLYLSIDLVDLQLQHPEVQAMISDKNRTFDLLLLEACVRTALIYSHIYKAPVIQVSSFSAVEGNFEAVGAPVHPLLYPLSLRQRINNLTIWEKIIELYNHFYIQYICVESEPVMKEMFRKYVGPDVPTIGDLMNNVHMLFLNVHPVFDGIRPVPPSVIYMGSMHKEEPKELPDDLQTFLNASINGVIYMSFGTNVDPSLLPADKIQTFLRVFSQLPYDVLWKWNADELPGRTENIRTSKWLPQSDLLKHPKIKLFITQGGLQSTDEAISAGVPLIGIPMLGDQWRNVEKYVEFGIGVQVDMESLDDKHLKNSIETVINNESYRRNVVRLRGLIEDQPQRPLERAVWWTEHVLRHGGARHLRAPAANMSWAQFLELDLILTVLSVFFSVLSILILISYHISKHVSRIIYVNMKLKTN